MMIKHTPSLFVILLLLLCFAMPVSAENSSVTILPPTPAASLPVERISQGQCVELGRYYDVSGVIGWSTQFSYYGKYDTDLSPQNGSYTLQRTIDHPMGMKGLGKYYIDPDIFGQSLGTWYQVSTMADANHEWAGNLQAFKVQTFCPSQLPTPESKVSQNQSVNVSDTLPLPIEQVTDILVVRGDALSYNDTRIVDGSRVWIFGIEDGILNLTTAAESFQLTAAQTQSLPEGRYHIIVDSPGKNTIVESAFDAEHEDVVSPFAATPILSFYGLSSQVAYGQYVDWMWKYSDDTLTLIDMQVQNPYLDIYSIETTDVVKQSGLTIKGYTNLREGSVVYAVIDEMNYGILATRAYGAVVGDAIGDMRQFVIRSQVEIDDLVTGKAIFVTVHGEHDAMTTAPFFVYNIEEGQEIPVQYNKYIGGNLFVPTPTPEIIILPSPTPIVITEIVKVTVTIPVPPPQASVNEAQWNAISGLAVIIGAIFAGLALGGYVVSVYSRREK
jgi:hypothetical protein